MSNANTRISSLAMSHVNRLSHRMTLCQARNTYIYRLLNNASSPNSAQLRCKLFLIIRNSSLSEVLILTIFYAVTL